LPSVEMLRVPLMNLVVALVAGTVAAVLLARYLPRTSVYNHFALSTVIPSGPSLASAPREAGPPVHIVTPGAEGRAVTTLRPSGKARFGDHVVDVVTEGDFIAAETRVSVISTDGMRVVVKTAA